MRAEDMKPAREERRKRANDNGDNDNAKAMIKVRLT